MLTHWFYLYIPWFFPFVAFAVLAPAARASRRARRSEVAESRVGERPRLSATSTGVEPTSPPCCRRRRPLARACSLLVSWTLLHFGFYPHR